MLLIYFFSFYLLISQKRMRIASPSFDGFAYFSGTVLKFLIIIP